MENGWPEITKRHGAIRLGGRGFPQKGKVNELLCAHLPIVTTPPNFPRTNYKRNEASLFCFSFLFILTKRNAIAFEGSTLYWKYDQHSSQNI